MPSANGKLSFYHGVVQNSEAMISIDMPAGPSEVLVIANRLSNPCHVAADLLSQVVSKSKKSFLFHALVNFTSDLLICCQAEHGPDSQVVLVGVGDIDLEPIEAELRRQCEELPRGDTAAKALAHSYTLLVPDMAEVCLYYSMRLVTKINQGINQCNCLYVFMSRPALFPICMLQSI